MTTTAKFGLTLSAAIFAALAATIVGTLISSSELFSRLGDQISFADTREAALLANAGVTTGASVVKRDPVVASAGSNGGIALTTAKTSVSTPTNTSAGGVPSVPRASSSPANPPPSTDAAPAGGQGSPSPSSSESETGILSVSVSADVEVSVGASIGL